MSPGLHPFSFNFMNFCSPPLRLPFPKGIKGSFLTLPNLVAVYSALFIVTGLCLTLTKLSSQKAPYFSEGMNGYFIFLTINTV
jgi:hypothetical protein